MAQEIERKFLVSNSGWKERVTRTVRLKDGLVAREAGRKVRVRSYGDRATICYKGARNGLARDEFEYEIPLGDAEVLFDHCEGRILEKTRHFVPGGAVTWEIDCYHGLLSGIVIAEVEMQSEDQQFDYPDWIGEEITNNPAYTKLNMISRRLQKEPAD